MAVRTSQWMSDLEACLHVADLMLKVETIRGKYFNWTADDET